MGDHAEQMMTFEEKVAFRKKQTAENEAAHKQKMEKKADAEAARAKQAADEVPAKQEESDAQQQRLTRKEGEEARQNRVNAKKQDMQARCGCQGRFKEQGADGGAVR